MWLTLCSNSLQAKDLGVYGTLYRIQEQDALEWISNRLHQLEQSGQLEAMNKQLQAKVSKKIYRPKPVLGLTKTTTPSVRYRDLTAEAPADIRDDQGNLIYRKGTRVQAPILYQSAKALLFLDGDDKAQVKWALKEYAQRGDLAKLVLINGSIIELMQENEIRFYFDQAGRLINHFKIKQIPAIVERKDNQLKISEIKI